MSQYPGTLSTAKKGDVVWLVKLYNNAGQMRYRRCVVVAWGKKQAHLQDADTGKMTHHRFYMQHLNVAEDATSAAFIFPQSANIGRESIALSRVAIEQELAATKAKVGNPVYCQAGLGARIAELSASTPSSFSSF